MKDILFDLDGTLTNPAVGITSSVIYALKHFGIEEKNENLLKFIGPPLVDSFMKFYGFSLEDANLAVAKYREYFSVTGLYENEVYLDIETLLETLVQEGYRLSIATSKPEEFAKIIINHFGLSKYFHGIYGATMDSSRSKKGDVITYALNNLGTNKALMIGDRFHDIEGAHQNNLKAIGVLYGFGDRDEMEKYQADYIVERPLEILEIVKTVK